MAVQGSRGRKARKAPNKGIMQFTKWKQAAIEKMLADDELMKLLTYTTKDWKSRSDVSEEARYDLLDKNIFQYKFIDPIADKQESFVSMGLAYFAPQEGFRQFSDDYIMGYFYLYILCSRHIRSTHQGDRADLIASRLYDILQSSRGIGMGELRMETQGEIWADNNSHGGYFLGFQVVDFK